MKPRGPPRLRRWMRAQAALTLTACFVLGSCVACAVVTVPAPAPAAKAPLPGAPTTRDRQGRIIAQVMVDGKGPFRFLVDTGANSSMVTPALLRKLAQAPGGATNGEQVQGITGSERLPWAPIRSLRIGDIVKENLRLPIGDSPVLNGIDGILGLAGLGAVRVVVDFHDNRVIIDRSSPGGLPGYLEIEAQRTPGGLLVIPARVGGVRVAAVIDTGASVTLGNSALRQALLRDAAKEEVNTQIFGVTRQTSKGGIALSPEVFLGPAAIEHLGIVYSDIPIFKIWHLDSQPALIIGMNVLSTVEVLALDYPHARVYMLPVESGQHSVSITTMHIESPLLNHGGGN
ncbi:MAG: aspartyl protease family protein [Steroidobacteraceae bacterium]